MLRNVLTGWARMRDDHERDFHKYAEMVKKWDRCLDENEQKVILYMIPHAARSLCAHCKLDTHPGCARGSNGTHS